MKKFVIANKNPLKGTIQLRGAKNSGYKLMIAAILSDQESRLVNVTPIGDIELITNLLTSLGVTVEHSNDHSFSITPAGINSYQVSPIFGAASRASLILAGPLLARFKKAVLPMPGGDKIGSSRDIDRHVEGLKALGAKVVINGDMVELSCDKLVGARYRFAKPTHTGTENLLIAAVLAEGTTILENTALEPEVDDLIAFLKSMGAKIKRTEGRTIEITGVSSLHGAIHKVMPDRNQAVTYAIAAILTQGDVIIEDAQPEALKAFLDKLDEINGGYEVGNYGIRFFYKGPLKPTKMETSPHPGFMTDWQPLWATLMTQAEGTSEIVERLYDNRFQYADVLNQAGANIELFDPKPADPEAYYYFNYSEKSNKLTAMHIHGKTNLRAIKVPVWDVRFGATLLLASLIAEGQSELTNIDHIQRGYYQIEDKLAKLGAGITLVEEEL